MKIGKETTYEIRVSAVKAILNNKPIFTIAEMYHVHRASVYRWFKKYKRDKNFKSLERKQVSGRPKKLDLLTQQELKEIISKPASKFGFETDFWTCPRLVQIINDKLNLDVSSVTVWRIVRKLGLTYQKPSKRYFEADEKGRQRWLKYELPKIISMITRYRAILYFEDESKISLAPVLAKTWAPKGETPIQKVTGNRGSISAMSSVTKSGKLLFMLYDKNIASAEVIHFLAQMLKHHKRRHLVVIMDKATCHTSQKTKAFIRNQKRLHVFYLPSRSPDFNPDENIWNYLKHHELLSHQAKTKKELIELTNKKLNKISVDRKLIKGLFFKCFVAELL